MKSDIGVILAYSYPNPQNGRYKARKHTFFIDKKSLYRSRVFSYQNPYFIES